MIKLCYFLFYFCGLYWQTAQGFWYHEPERTLEWQHGILAAKILKNLANSNPEQNVIFSPLSIHTAMTVLYLGANGETAQELYHALMLSSNNREIIANDFAKFAKDNLNRKIPNFGLRMASALVVNDRYQVPDSIFPLTHNLSTYVAHAKFSDGDRIVGLINTLVERITNSKIKGILEEGSINNRKIAVLVNALYLKALWRSPFDDMSTRKQYFQLESNERIEVDMMSNEGQYRWARISKLSATVVELPYENTNLTMLIVLPDKNVGLKNLEKTIKEESIDWNDISNALDWDNVELFLPKFKIEYEMDVREQFEKLGVFNVFSDYADLSGLFNNSGPAGVEKIKHKAFLEVNEAGTEGAAATIAEISNRMGFIGSEIRVDHPFVFVIRNRDAVFFIGHVAKP